MPEFIADYIPDGLDDFTSGYLQAAEFTNQEEIEYGYDEHGEQNEDCREDVAGWSQRSIDKATRDCAKFQADNAALLESYYELSGRGEESAGNDFWYSSNGHGVGFFDRGNENCFDQLQDAACKCGGWDVYVSDSGQLELS